MPSVRERNATPLLFRSSRMRTRCESERPRRSSFQTTSTSPARNPAIGIGGPLTRPPLPHHRAYGSVPRRFGGLSVYQLFHGEEAQTGEASFGEGPVQSFHGAQPPGSLRAEDSRTGQPFGDLEAAKFPVSPAARLPLDPNDASQSPSDPAVE